MKEFLIFLQKTKFVRMLMFRIEGRKSSPEVLIDRDNSRIEISGSSTFRNTSWFYSNVLKWAIAFNQKGSCTTTIDIKLNKINDSSSKWLMLIIQKISTLAPEHNIIVNWYYQPTNINVQLNGERLKLNALVPVNLIAA